MYVYIYIHVKGSRGNLQEGGGRFEHLLSNPMTHDTPFCRGLNSYQHRVDFSEVYKLSSCAYQPGNSHALRQFLDVAGA